MYWFPKLQKTPTGARFITASKSCSTKPLSGATIIEKLNIINTRKRPKKISTYDFSILYTRTLHNLLIKVLSEIIHFVFKSKVRVKIGFSATSIYWTSNGVGKRFFTEKNLLEVITFLIKSCYFNIGNMVFKQDIGILMGIEPAQF